MSNISDNINFPLVTELSTIPVNSFGADPKSLQYSTNEEGDSRGNNLVLPRIFPWRIETDITTNQDNLVEVCKIDLSKALAVQSTGNEKDVSLENSFRSYNRAVKVVFITGDGNSTNQIACHNSYYFSLAVDNTTSSNNRFVTDFTYEFDYEQFNFANIGYYLVYGGLIFGAQDFCRFKITDPVAEQGYPSQTYANAVEGDFTNNIGQPVEQSVYAVEDSKGTVLTLELNLKTAFNFSFTYTDQQFYGWVEII